MKKKKNSRFGLNYYKNMAQTLVLCISDGLSKNTIVKHLSLRKYFPPLTGGSINSTYTKIIFYLKIDSKKIVLKFQNS